MWTSEEAMVGWCQVSRPIWKDLVCLGRINSLINGEIKFRGRIFHRGEIKLR